MKLKIFLSNLLLSLGGAIILSLTIFNSLFDYNKINLPFFAPPRLLFPIVWSILYILMAYSATLIIQSEALNRNEALSVYYRQLLINFLWPFLFFYLKFYGFAFLWIVFLWANVLYMILIFYPISSRSALLQIPYLIWISFAGILNLTIYYLN